MGETTCLVHGFSYASAIPNESKQGNAIHVLGESISFGKYKNESLGWDRWSTCSHKKYVEEAERYSRPGSVAQKKAFFEAHYKKVAAQKAAALLEQENAAKRETERNGDFYSDGEEQRVLLNNSVLDSDEKTEKDGVVNCDEQNTVDVEEICKSEGSVVITRDSPVKNQNAVSVSEDSGIPQIERPLLKRNSVSSKDIPSMTSKNQTSLSSLKSSIQRKTWITSSTPAKPFTPLLKKENVIGSAKKSSVVSMDKKRFSPKSLRALMSSIHTQKHGKEKIPASRKTGTSVIDRISSQASKPCTTPLRTPLAASKGIGKHPAATPQSENRRMGTRRDSSAHMSKTSGPKWHILSSVGSKSMSAYGKKPQSPTTSTPFILRTEERAAKRKQKLEEKFDANANDVQKVLQPERTLKEKAGNEFRKLSHNFCFKARPLPDFYNKQREAHKIPMNKKLEVVQSQSAVLTRSSSKEKQGTISMPPPMCITKSGTSKNNVRNPGKVLPSSLPKTKRITHENTSPNIQ